jgi:hypothetical protein
MTIFNTIVSIMERMIDVMQGIKRVAFSPWILISPGSFPNGIPVRAARNRHPPIRIMMILPITSIRAKFSIFQFQVESSDLNS